MTPRHATCDAQLTRAETIVSIPDQEVGGLDLDAMLAPWASCTRSMRTPRRSGDPKAALQVYERAAASARVLFATDSITQDAI